MEKQGQMSKPGLKEFIPLIWIFLGIVAFVFARQVVQGYDLMRAMRDFMGAFFVVFGAFKLVTLKAFAESYSSYDIIAAKVPWWGYVYPFIELALGFAYLFNVWPIATNIITLVLMVIGSIGIYQALVTRGGLTCACLGALFKIPLTYVSLIEDILMAIMALFMLVLNR